MTASPENMDPPVDDPAPPPGPGPVDGSAPSAAAPARRSLVRAVLAAILGDQPTVLGALLGLALLGASVPLGLRYAQVDVAQTQMAVPAFGRTVAAADEWREWMDIKPARVRALLDALDHNPWETLVLRTVLSRWRMRPVAPGLFDGLMARWSRGWWSVPDPQKWTDMMRAVDARWLKARAAAIAQSASPGGVRTPPVQSLPDGTCILFPYRTRTAQVGSRIAILMDVPAASVPKSPRIAWCAGLYGIVPWRVQTGTVRMLPGAGAGQQRIAITIDLSAEPLWLNPRTIAHSMVLLGGCPGAKVLELRFEDSPLLPVPGKTRPKPTG